MKELFGTLDRAKQPEHNDRSHFSECKTFLLVILISATKQGIVRVKEENTFVIVINSILKER